MVPNLISNWDERLHAVETERPKHRVLLQSVAHASPAVCRVGGDTSRSCEATSMSVENIPALNQLVFTPHEKGG
jgi:hypothetical protein